MYRTANDKNLILSDILLKAVIPSHNIIGIVNKAIKSINVRQIILKLSS